MLLKIPITRVPIAMNKREHNGWTSSLGHQHVEFPPAHAHECPRIFFLLSLIIVPMLPHRLSRHHSDPDDGLYVDLDESDTSDDSRGGVRHSSSSDQRQMAGELSLQPHFGLIPPPAAMPDDGSVFLADTNEDDESEQQPRAHQVHFLFLCSENNFWRQPYHSRCSRSSCKVNQTNN